MTRPAKDEERAVVDAQISSLETANVLREPVLRSAAATLNLEPGSHGLDLGCGIGLQSLLLAEATQPDGRVTGLDLSSGLLSHARERVRAHPCAERIEFRQGDLHSLPFPDDSFDWAWSADCAGYPAGGLLAALREATRVVRPGGIVAILGWTSQVLLPGHSLLEARLNATCSGYAAHLQGQAPETHFLRALRWFSQAGLVDARSHTFVGQAQAPLGEQVRAALASLFEMLWTVAAASQADRQEYARLCRAGSPDFVLDLPEYCAFFTYSMFWGRVSK